MQAAATRPLGPRQPGGLLLPALLLAAAALAGCAGNGVEVQHVHGVAFDPAAGLYVATHGGLVHRSHDGTWSYVGEQRYDLMGFAQDGVRHAWFYAGGHPGLLGLAASEDGGVTWTSRSYQGQADIHALTGVPGVQGALYAWWHGHPLRYSGDGGYTWQDLAEPAAMPLGLAALGPDRVLMATPAGLLESSDGGRTFPRVALPGAVAKVAAARDGSTLFAARITGPSQVDAVRSLDGGATWEPVEEAQLRGVAHEVSFAANPVDARHWFAATSGGAVFESRDAGATWERLR
jgi:photosystem II stability/assembly factor-like uncharacterized protein